MFKGENDRLKLMVLYSGMEDNDRLVRAASGTLATLTLDPDLAAKVTTVSWFLVEGVEQSTFERFVISAIQML